MLSRRNVHNYEACLQQVQAFLTMMMEEFRFQPIDYDQYWAIVGPHKCYVSFWPDQDICTLVVVSYALPPAPFAPTAETFHYSQPEQLKAKLSHLKQGDHVSDISA